MSVCYRTVPLRHHRGKTKHSRRSRMVRLSLVGSLWETVRPSLDKCLTPVSWLNVSHATLSWKQFFLNILTSDYRSVHDVFLCTRKHITLVFHVYDLFCFTYMTFFAWKWHVFVYMMCFCVQVIQVRPEKLNTLRGMIVLWYLSVLRRLLRKTHCHSLNKHTRLVHASILNSNI